MKKTLYIIAALAAVACTKEANAPQEKVSSDSTPAPYNGPVTEIFASVDEETKTAFGPESESTFPVYWQAGDSVVVNGCNSKEVSIDPQNPKSASYVIEGAVSAPLCAVYPKSAYVADSYSSANKTMDITIPASQTYAAGQYDPSAAIMLGYSESGYDVSFKQAAGYYKLVIEGTVDTDNIKKVKIRKRDGGNIAGTYTATFGASGCTLAEKDVTDVITVDCGDGVAQGTEILVVLPAINYTDGLIITAYDVNGQFHSFGTTAVDFATVNRAKILKKELSYNPQAGKITSAADWEDFAAQFNDDDLYKYAGNGTVVLANDIEAETYTMLNRTFQYTFDGQGNTMTMTAGKNQLFLSIGVGGVVKNLILAGEVVKGSAANGFTVLANSISGGTVQDCINNANINANSTDHISVAAFAKAATNTAVITRCRNNGNFTVNGDCTESDVNAYAGGIVARISGTATLTDCKNTGDITITLTNTGHKIGYAGFGGITGWISRPSGKYPEVKLNNCDNEGKITVSATDDSKDFATCVGGIAGIAWGDHVSSSDSYHLGVPTSTNNQNKVFFKDCDNSGTLTNNVVSSCASNKIYGKSITGGIAGAMFGFISVYVNEETPIFDNCTSTGDVIPYCNDGEGMSERPGIESVCGGLLGIGANVSFKNCTVTAQVGTYKRLAFAVSGGIGVACGKFRFDGCTFCPKVIMARCFYTGQNSWALIATSPKKTGTASSANLAVNFAGAANPSVNGSVVKNSTLGAWGLSLNLSTVKWNDTTATLSPVPGKFDSLDNCEQFGVQGNYSTASAPKVTSAPYCAQEAGDVTFTDNTYSATKPEVTPTPVVEPMSQTAAPAAMALDSSHIYTY